MSTSTTQTVTHQRRRLTQEYRGLPSGTEFHTATLPEAGLTLAWVESQPPASAMMTTVSDYLRQSYDLPPEARYCCILDRPDSISEVIEQAPEPSTPRRYRTSGGLWGLPDGSEVNVSTSADGEHLAWVEQGSPHYNTVGMFDINDELRATYGAPPVAQCGRYCTNSIRVGRLLPVVEETVEPEQRTRGVEYPRYRVTATTAGIPWARGTEVRLAVVRDADSLLISEERGDGAWPLNQGRADGYGVDREYVGWYAWWVTSDLSTLAESVTDTPEPTPDEPTLPEGVERRRVTADAGPRWPVGTEFEVWPRPDMGNNVTCIADTSAGSTWNIEDAELRSLGAPVEYAGRQGWYTERGELLDRFSEPFAATPVEPGRPSPLAVGNRYVVTEESYGYWRRGTTLTVIRNDDQLYVGAPPGPETTSFFTDGVRFGPQYAGWVTWHASPGVFLGAVRDAEPEASDTPTPVYHRVPDDFPVSHGGIQGLPAGWRGELVWVDSCPERTYAHVYPVGEGIAGQGGAPNLTQELVTEHGLPQYMVGRRGWNTDHGLVAQLRQNTPEPSVTAEATDLEAERDRLRREIQEARDLYERKMQEIGSKGMEWAQRHGYESSVESFLEEQGIDAEVQSRDFSAEILVRLRVTGTIAEGTTPSEVTRDFIRQSISIDETYDEDERMASISFDSDWDTVEYDVASIVVESAHHDGTII